MGNQGSHLYFWSHGLWVQARPLVFSFERGRAGTKLVRHVTYNIRDSGLLHLLPDFKVIFLLHS